MVASFLWHGELISEYNFYVTHVSQLFDEVSILSVQNNIVLKFAFQTEESFECLGFALAEGSNIFFEKQTNRVATIWLSWRCFVEVILFKFFSIDRGLRFKSRYSTLQKGLMSRSDFWLTKFVCKTVSTLCLLTNCTNPLTLQPNFDHPRWEILLASV